MKALSLQKMKRRRCLNVMLSLVTVAMAVAPWLASVSAEGSASDRRHFHPSQRIGYPTNSFTQSTYSDFDGDNKPDEAELDFNGQYKTIRINLSSSWGGVLSFKSNEFTRGKLLSADLDQDNDQDLLWVSQENPRTILYWLGNGYGNFTYVAGFKPNPRQLSLLLSDDAALGVSKNQNVSIETDALLPGDSYSLPQSRCDNLYVYSKVLPARRTVHHISAPCQAIPRKRGPPSDLS